MTPVMGIAAYEPAREVLSRVRPAIDAETVRDRLRAVALGYLSAADFDRLVRPEKMLGPEG